MRHTWMSSALVLVLGLPWAGLACAQQLYWIDTRYAAPTINRCNPDGTGNVSLALPAGSLPEGLAVDPVGRRVYWTEAAYAGARVRRAALDLSFPTDVFTGSSVRGIAVDGAGGRLFWVTSDMVTGPTFYRGATSAAGYSLAALLGTAYNPRGLAYVPPPNEGVILADALTGLLYRVTVNGVPSVFLGIGGVRPYGVALDATALNLYWTDFLGGRIYRTPAAGGGAALVLANLAYPTAIAVDATGGRLYWVEGAAGAQKVRRANLDGSGVQNLGLPLTTYGGIAFAPASVIAGADDGAGPALEFALGAVSPNPARGTARIEYTLPAAQRVRLAVLDVQGREVAVLADGIEPAGRRAQSWRARGAAAGVYFARLTGSGRTLTRRFSLVR